MALRDIEKGQIHHCFIEMSACAGSCIGGPVMEKYHRSPVREYLAVAQYAGEKDFAVPQPEPAQIRRPFAALDRNTVMPDEMEITRILREMGKFKPSQELNCGSCGYDTCREKAIAIFQGKAEVSMCLPYLQEKAESFSDTVVRNSPNGLLVLNDDLEIQQINESALRILNLRAASDVMGDPVVRILDPGVFMKVRQNGRGVFNEKVYLAQYGRYVEQTVVPTKESRMIIAILRDITAEEEERARKEEISRETVEVADKVVDRQMRIVQEIASLLGETAAETKVAMTKLKESIRDE